MQLKWDLMDNVFRLIVWVRGYFFFYLFHCCLLNVFNCPVPGEQKKSANEKTLKH